MLDKIRALELESRKLEPSPQKRKAWYEQVMAYTDAFIDGLENNKTFQQESGNGSALTEHPITESGKPLENLLSLLEREVDRPGINPASGGHLGYIPGGGIFPTALGDFLAAATNRYSGIFFANPGAVRIENYLIRWMCRLVGYPENALGNLASGGSIANLIAIVTARDKLGIRATEVPRATIYLTRQVHHCIQKAIRIAGLSESVIRYIPMDNHFRMNAKSLRRQVLDDRAAGLRPFLLVGSAGTTDTGAIDPLNELADVAAEFGMWYHIDAAYGGFFLLVDDLRKKFRGIERSDSLAIDPHKGLFLSYGLGALLIRDVQALQQAHYYQAAYMQDALSDPLEASPADLSPELTKHFRGMRMWLSLHLFGLSPFRACLEEKRMLCLYFYERIGEMGFERGPEPELSVCIYRYVPGNGDANSFNLQLIAFVQTEGDVFLSSTTIEGVVWLRLAVLSFRTHLSTINKALSSLERGLFALQSQP